MQSPIIIFDHSKHTVSVVQPGQPVDKKSQEALAEQQAQMAGSGNARGQ